MVLGIQDHCIGVCFVLIQKIHLVIFSSFLAILLWVAYRWYHHAEDKEEKAIACCISAIIVMVIALNMLSDLIETDKIGSIFFICTGILLRHAGKMPLKPANR